jgi:RNA-directed DNA polymerase
LSDISESLFAQVVDWSNLLLAYRKASRGKRGKTSAATFEYQVADKLLTLQAELTAQTYQPAGYVHFTIHDPKTRKISAAPFRDRVTHHALCNIIEPLFEAQFHPHSYANRINKGTHRAVDHLQACSRHFRYCLRVDIVKHFPSIDHLILQDIIADTVRDERALWLVERIIASGEGVLDDQYPMHYFEGDDVFARNRATGLPIGNLTSQFWSNVYLNPLDWFIEYELGCRGYCRYVDDMALFSDSKRQLYAWKQAIVDFLATLRLTIHDEQAQVVPCQHGIPWLGFVVYPTHRKLKRRNVVKFTRRLKARWREYNADQITFAELDASVQGWINHVRYADTWGLRRHILGRDLHRFDEL